MTCIKPGAASSCFIEAAAALDLEILTEDFQRQQRSLRSGTLDVQSFAGEFNIVVSSVVF
jgi:hypothetical protein